MARANVARRHGDDFQARLFWLRAASLLDPKSPIVKVALETGPKGFDDIWIDYDPAAAPRDHEGMPILRRHQQAKWHTTAGTFGYDDLADPAFINAERYSLLEKAFSAQQRHAPDGAGCRFELVTNWRVRADDPLLDLIRKEQNALNLKRLFDGGERSRMGQVRKLWCKHLGVDDAALHTLARCLAISEITDSLDSLRERLDDRFAAVGMKRYHAGETGFPYDDLTFKLLAQGRVEFDRAGFRAMCEHEKLLDPAGRPREVLTIGIRSFIHPIDNLEDRCQQILNLVPLFDGRYIHLASDWQSKILTQVTGFLQTEGRASDEIRLILDAHTSIAFTAGAALNVKSGKRIELEQRHGGRRLWSSDDVTPDPAWPVLASDIDTVGDGPDIVVAASMTHDVSGAVRAHVASHLPDVGRILHARPASGPSQGAVQSGSHAALLAETLAQRIRALAAAQGRAHIFIAGPNGFTFFLGQHQQALGPVTLYEWDFDRRPGGYTPSMTIGA